MKRNKYFVVSVLIIIIGLFLILHTFNGNSTDIYSVRLTNQIDPEIVLINIGDGDRASIGKMLLAIDSCKPILIALDTWFVNERDSIQDSVLTAALRTVQNDILGYTLDSSGKPLKSNLKFKSVVSDEGLATVEQIDGISSIITPIRIIDSVIHELFPLTIIKHWKPEFKHSIKLNQSIPIKFTRTLEQFVHFDNMELKTKNHCNFLNNKIILLGYLGPSNEDKHFTPIRFGKNYADYQPDTYGLVMIANEIRTILEYEKK
jgi:CHASE2 domain-containing sensor protein